MPLRVFCARRAYCTCSASTHRERNEKREIGDRNAALLALGRRPLTKSVFNSVTRTFSLAFRAIQKWNIFYLKQEFMHLLRDEAVGRK